MPERIVTVPGEGIILNGGIDESVNPLDLADNKWASGLDVEPLPDGVRRRLGMIYSSDPLAGDIAVDQTAQDDDGPGFTQINPLLSTTRVGQGFQLGAVRAVESIEVKALKGSVHFGQTLFCSIRHDSASLPGAAVTGYDESDFTTLNSVSFTENDGSDISDQFDAVDRVVFSRIGSGAPLLNTATPYWFTIRSSLEPGSDTVFFASDLVVAGGPYASGVAARSAGSWASNADIDMLFRINYVPLASLHVTGVFDYKLSDGTQRHILVMDDGEIYKVSGVGALTSVGSLDSAHGVDVLPSIAEADERMLITNNEDGDPSKQYYLVGGVDTLENEGIAAPTTQHVLATVGGGSLPADSYYVDYYYWNSDINQQSNTKHGSDLANAPLQAVAANGIINITNLPTAVVRSGDRADYLRFNILAQSTDIGKWRYSGVEVLISSLPGAEPVQISDPSLFGDDAGFDHDVPPQHSIKLGTSDRQFIAGIKDLPNTVQWSRLDGLDIDVSSFSNNRRRDIGVSGGDYVTALCFVPPNTVVVGMKNSIWALDASRPEATEEEEIAKGVGIAGHRSCLSIGSSLYFWSDGDDHKGPMVWDRQQVRPLLGLDKTVKGGLNLSRLNLASCAHLAKDEARFQFWTLVSSDGSTRHDRVAMYDYNLDAWSVYRLEGVVLGEVETSNRDEVYLGGYDDARERRCDVGDTDLGVAIDGQLVGKVWHFGDLDMIKKLRALRYILNTVQSGTVGLSLDINYGAQVISRTLDLSGASGSVLGTDEMGADFILGGTGARIDDDKFCASFRTLQPTFSGSSAWRLQKIAWRIQPTRRR